MAGKSRGLPDMGRAKRKQALRHTIVIWCEGESEAGYFEALITELRIAGSVRINPHGCGSDPKNLIAAAKLDQATSQPDAIWLVFDYDKRDHFKSCCTKAKKQGFRVAWSDFCFEYWLLLHHRYTTAGHNAAEDVEAALKAVLPAYRKGNDDELWKGFTPLRHTAVERAKRAFADMQKMAADPEFPRPATTVHELIEALEMLAPTTGKR